MEINVFIDELTNCLIESSSGNIKETEYFLVDHTIDEEEAVKLNKQGWKFDWSLPQRNSYDVYQLYLKESTEIQGMIAIKHIVGQYYTHIDIVEAAPFNVGISGKYKGVGAHLFAIACKLSWDVGNEGYVQFTAKTDLISHYENTLNAKHIDAHNMYIDTYGAVELIHRYFKEG